MILPIYKILKECAFTKENGESPSSAGVRVEGALHSEAGPGGASGATEQELIALFNQAAVGMAIATLEGCLQKVNPRFCEMLGLSWDRVIGRNVLEFIEEDDRHLTRGSLPKLVAGEIGKYIQEKRFVRVDGSRLWTLTSVTLLRDAQGNPQKCIGVVEDISQRKKAEEETAHAMERMQLALSAGRLGDWSWDAATDVMTMGSEAAGFFSTNPEVSVTRTALRESVHPADRERIRLAAERAVQTGSDYVTEYRVRRGSGFRWVSASGKPVFGPDHKVIGMIGVIQDITARKEAEELRSRLASVVESSDDAIISMSLDTVIITWNRGAERMFGYSPEEAIGKSVAMLIPDFSEDEEPEILRRLLGGERIDHYETVRMRKDGTVLNVSLTVSLVYDGQGEISGVSKILRDITERKRSERALKAAQDELKKHAENLEKEVAERTAMLRETIAELEAFSYSVSHDMRSPLRAMQGYSDALLEDYKGKLDPTGEDYLRRIRRAAARMDLLIQDVLAYSRISKTEIQLHPVDVNNVVMDVITHYPALHKDHADITVVSPLPSVMGHEAYLTQIVSNFLGNAVKFVSPGKRPAVKIYAQSEGSTVKLVFEDNGIGIAPEHVKQIFQIFGRVYSEKKFEGTGIGLAIAKKAAERMGGSVGVISKLGEGSRFYAVLNRGS